MVASLAVASAIGSVLGPLVGKGLRWLARRTSNKRDDKIADAVARFLEENPQVIEEIAKRIPRP